MSGGLEAFNESLPDKGLIIHHITARDLPDLWFQAVHDVLDVGKRFKIDRGSFAGQTRLEYDYFIGHVKDPSYGSGTAEILPHIPEHIGIPDPVCLDYVYGGGDYERSYVEYVMTGEKEKGESYTYGQRLTDNPSFIPLVWKMYKDIFVEENIFTNKKIFKTGGSKDRVVLSQVELIIETYKKHGHRNNQMVLQVAQPEDCLLFDPPCLRHIDTRIQDNKLHFIIYFRSWDLWAGLPANLAGIEFLQKYMATMIGVEQGEFIVESKGLHLYGYAEDLAKMRMLQR